ncbi:LysR family transcriptional regulator [Wukongibacter sp. M2B1]|uniref:LysR family transcriptional regulator n=1 Tax=Wukongibacter sp. M2B1 TaxID=3088895 RepID=UPI003D78BC6A
MDFEDLKTFITLSEFKNFTKTAEQLHLVQSTVSNRIKKVEDSVGKKLFIRNNKTVVLTNTGKLFLKYAKRLTDIHSTAISELHALETFEDILNIGSVHSIYDSRLHELVFRYVCNCNSISTNIIIGHSNELFQKLHDNILDIAFTYYKINSSKLLNIPYKKDELILTTSPVNNTFIDGISNNDLKKLPIIYSNIILSSTSNFPHEIFSDNYIFQLHINILSEVIPFLEKGIGYCFLPRSLVNSKLDNGKLIEIKLLEMDPPVLQSYMIVNKKKLNSTAVVKWFDCNFPELL